METVTSLLIETGVLCVAGTMSTCAACELSMSEQERCGRFQKASHENRCMYLVFGEYCDSMLAQAASRGHIEPIRRAKKIHKIRFRNDGEIERRRTEKNRSLERKEIRSKRRSQHDL